MKLTRYQTTALTGAIKDAERDIARLSEQEKVISTAQGKARTESRRSALASQLNGVRAAKTEMQDRIGGLQSARETVLEYERLSLSLRACLKETEGD